MEVFSKEICHFTGEKYFAIQICYFVFENSPFSRLIWKEVSPAMKPPSCSTACKNKKRNKE